MEGNQTYCHTVHEITAGHRSLSGTISCMTDGIRFLPVTMTGRFSNFNSTVKPLKTDTPRDEQKCPSYRGVRLIEVIFNRNLPLGHR